MRGNLAGAALGLGAMGAYATHDAVIKLLGASYSPLQTAFFVALLSLPVLAVVAARRPKVSLWPRHPGWVGLRTLCMTLNVLSAMTAFALLPLTQVYAILFTMPLLTGGPITRLGPLEDAPGPLARLLLDEAQAGDAVSLALVTQHGQALGEGGNFAAAIPELSLSVAERRRGLTEQIARLDIRAPVSGIIHQLQVTTPRSVIRPAEPVMYLIPQDRPLVIAARIAPINVDEVHVGQQVVLRFSAFSSRTTPEIDGTLARVSADAVVDEASRMQFYRAEVTLPQSERDKLGDLALIPGMPVEVYVQTGERSPLAYLMKPLSDYFTRAFREN